jgi:RecJ-like exonuclease
MSVIKCPVCDGAGLVSRPPWVAGDVQTWTTSSTTSYPCRVCGGGGVIAVTDIHPLESIGLKHYCPLCGAKLEAPTE